MLVNQIRSSPDFIDGKSTNMNGTTNNQSALNGRAEPPGSGTVLRISMAWNRWSTDAWNSGQIPLT